MCSESWYCCRWPLAGAGVQQIKVRYTVERRFVVFILTFYFLRGPRIGTKMLSIWLIFKA